jgi:hypothetical protein
MCIVMRVEISLANHSVAPSCVGGGWRRAAIKNAPTPSGTRSMWLLCPAAERHGWRTPSITAMATYRCDGRKIRPSQRTDCDPDSVRIQDRTFASGWMVLAGKSPPWTRLGAACVRHRESTASTSLYCRRRPGSARSCPGPPASANRPHPSQPASSAGACRNLYGALERPRFDDGPGAGSVPSCTRTVAQVTRTPIWLGLRVLCCLVLGENSR